MQVELSSLLTARQVAARRGRHVRTIQRDTAEGKLIPAGDVAGVVLYRPEDVEAYLNACRKCDAE